ncbi:type VII secretion integral membrane protein EccD [Streptomyces sp. R1]|uniref:type VII secretion integral membrane protein EccD n=1 Tax=Streptomyces sp. R1 TaxID=1509279 RepID=UPI001E2C7378|nr:type VII secretion integral membrane protein EccD [Streptomyces sp. R1]MCC8338952.1 type VII secretion integral membrane protein EccD [Streptomyces sp. R1]
MADSAAAGLCRLTVRAPEKVIDLAVPSDIPVMDLLPTLVDHAGEGLAESGLEHGGWVLQRLSGQRLEEESSLDSLGLKDGETVLLRPHTETIPEILLDDLVDGIAGSMRDRPFGWTPVISRRLLLCSAVVAAFGSLVVLTASATPSAVRAVGAAVVALLLLAGAGSASRAVGDAGAGAALGVPAVVGLAVAGWLLPGGHIGTSAAGHEVLGSRLLAAGAAGAGGSMLAVAVVGTFATLYVGVALMSIAVSGAGVLIIAAGLSLSEVAGVLALAAVVLGAFVPSLSFRLAGFRLPPLPSNAEQLQEGIEPHSPSVVEARAVVADAWMTGLYGAVGIICTASVAGLALEPHLPELLVLGVLSMLLLLHGRGLGNTVQRLALTIPAVLGAATLTGLLAADSSPLGRVLMAAGLLGVTAAVSIAAWTVPGRRLVPYWGRAAELLHTLAAVAMLPLALWVLGLYAYLRGLQG